MATTPGQTTVQVRDIVAGIVTASLANRIKRNILDSCGNCVNCCSTAFSSIFNPRNQVSPNARAATAAPAAPRQAWIQITETRNAQGDNFQVSYAPPSTAPASPRESQAGEPITTRVSIPSSAESLEAAILEMVLIESALAPPVTQEIHRSNYPVMPETREFIVNVKNMIISILENENISITNKDSILNKLRSGKFNDKCILENIHHNGYMTSIARSMEEYTQMFNEFMENNSSELVGLANEVALLQASSLPLVVVNPDGTPGGLQVAVKVGDTKLEGMSGLVSEILKFFDIISLDQSIEVTLPADHGGGARKKDTELLLGKHRKVFKEGRKKMVMIKGKAVPLVDVRKLHAKWEKMKL